MPAAKFQNGDRVIVRIEQPNLFARWGRFQDQEGNIIERQRRSYETLYLVEFDNGKEVLIPSQLLYLASDKDRYPPAPSEENVRQAKAVARLRPGSQIILGEHSALMPEDEEARQVQYPYNAEGKKATLISKGLYNNVVEIEGLSGRWVMPILAYGSTVKEVID